jgi:hypothetical protein
MSPVLACPEQCHTLRRICRWQDDFEFFDYTGFRCLADINQGPLNGCNAGEGIRWDAKEGETQLLESFPFKCTGAATEQLKTARTDDNTVVMLADFYRQGDGVNESFTAHMFVSEVDEAPDLPGIQNVWIEGVGCGEAIANFN